MAVAAANKRELVCAGHGARQRRFVEQRSGPLLEGGREAEIEDRADRTIVSSDISTPPRLADHVSF